jgi:hypothetical protein
MAGRDNNRQRKGTPMRAEQTKGHQGVMSSSRKAVRSQKTVERSMYGQETRLTGLGQDATHHLEDLLILQLLRAEAIDASGLVSLSVLCDRAVVATECGRV